MILQVRARNRLKENLLSNSTLLWWGAVLLDRLLCLVCHGFGVFSSEQGGRCEVTEEYASGFAGHPGGAILLTVRAHWEC
jgi:hypothetical protein